MRVLVTGAAGFVGSHVATRLAADGHDVLGLDCFRSVYDVAGAGNLASLCCRPSFRFVPSDLAVDDLAPFLGRVDAVVHLAGRPGVRPSWGASFGRYLDDNVLATRRLADAMERCGVRRLVFASSSSVYGEIPGPRPVDEAAPCRPLSPYAVTKLAAERLLDGYREKGSLDVVALRYFTVYGPGQRPDMAIQRFVNAALDGATVDIHGDGRQRRDLTYVGDCVDATVAALGLPPGTYNVAGGEVPSLLDILGTVQEVVGAPVRRRHVLPAPGDVTVTMGDTRALRRLGVRPGTPVREGILAQVEATAARGGGPDPAVTPLSRSGVPGRPRDDRGARGTLPPRPVPAGLR